MIALEPRSLPGLIVMCVVLALTLSGCDSPSGGFERDNENDPLSDSFNNINQVFLTVETDTMGAITLEWEESNSVGSRYVLEKSLNDTTSFKQLAELGADQNSFIDTTRNVRKNTYYRVTSYLDFGNGVTKNNGSATVKLDFGVIEIRRVEYLPAVKKLVIDWDTDTPFITYFELSSNKSISETSENVITFPSEQISHSFLDPLLDITYDRREYTIRGYIESEGDKQLIAEEELSFSPSAAFPPRDIDINIINEQDWLISWSGRAFFTTGVELIRETDDGDITIDLPPDTESYLDTLILKRPGAQNLNQNRRYRLRYTSAESYSQTLTESDRIDIYAPSIYLYGSDQDDPNSLTLGMSVSGPDNGLVKEFIVETVSGGVFSEYARFDASSSRQFTDTSVDEEGNAVYRLRTLTSSPGDVSQFRFMNFYGSEYVIFSGMNNVTAMELGADKRYLAATSFTEGVDNKILVADIETKRTVSEITIPSEQISDLKISPDNEFIYFSVSSENAIYRADFPSGSNVEKIIDDASVNNTSVFQIAVSPDHSFIIGTGGQGFVKKWSLDTFEPEFLFAEYNTPTFYLYKDIAISPDGRTIGGNNGTPFVMDAADGSIREYLPWSPKNVTDLQFSPDGRYFSYVTDFKTVNVYSTESWTLLDQLDGKRSDFHPDEQKLLYFNNSGMHIKNLDTGVTNRSLKSPRGYSPIPDIGNSILFIDDEKFAWVNGGGNIEVWSKSSTKRWIEVN